MRETHSRVKLYKKKCPKAENMQEGLDEGALTHLPCPVLFESASLYPEPLHKLCLLKPASFKLKCQLNTPMITLTIVSIMCTSGK